MGSIRSRTMSVKAHHSEGACREGQLAGDSAAKKSWSMDLITKYLHPRAAIVTSQRPKSCKYPLVYSRLEDIDPRQRKQRDSFPRWSPFRLYNRARLADTFVMRLMAARRALRGLAAPNKLVPRLFLGTTSFPSLRSLSTSSEERLWATPLAKRLAQAIQV